MRLRDVLSVTLALQGAAVAVALRPATAVAQARPMIEHIEPTAGPPGTRVRIVGRGFLRSYRVLFNERPVQPAEVLPERITVVVPDGAQTGRWVLSNGGDEVESETFRVTGAQPAPAITGVEPASASPGAEVTLRGENFSARPTDNTVRIGNLPMVVRSGDTNTLRVIVPEGAQSGPVFVRTLGGEGRSEATLTINERLIVREFTPVAVAPGGRVTLRGGGFAPSPAGNRVTINGLAARVLRATPTEMEVEIPLAARTGTIAVAVGAATRYETSQRLFVGPAPVIRAFEPPQGAAGARVTLRGTQFGSDASRVAVTFGGRAATVNTVAPQEVVVTVPEGAASGRVAVTVNGVGPVESSTDFTVLAPVSLARFEPRAGDVGDTVTLSGTGFSTTPAQNTVTLGNTPARVLTATGTQLTVEVPQGGHSGQWSVTVPGNGTARLREPFMVTQRPRITAVEPDRGTPGSRVTLRGVNFPTDQALVNIRLNGQDVPIASYARDAVVVTVPSGAQTGRFQLVARLQGTGSAPVDFTVLQPVTLREVAPPAAPVGTTVTLRGEGFEPDPARLTVRMGPTVIRPTRVTTTEIAFTVPRAARGGPITVEAPGRQTVTSPEPFVITVAPALVSVTPPQGPPGTRLTIRGRNFGTVVGNVGVTIGATSCPVASVTPAVIVCEVPDGAQTGRVTVRIANAGETQSRADFRVLAAPSPGSAATPAQ